MAQRGELESDSSSSSSSLQQPQLVRICDDSKFDEIPSFENLKNPDQISSFKQRLFNINNNVNNFWDSTYSSQTDLLKVNSILPQRKQLVTRRSKRCSKCDKLLIKPDLIPAKTEFKRIHLGIFYMPKFLLQRCQKLSPNSNPTNPNQFELSVWNPLSALMHIKMKIPKLNWEEEEIVAVLDEADPVLQSEHYLEWKANKEKQALTTTSKVLERTLNLVKLQVVPPNPNKEGEAKEEESNREMGVGDLDMEVEVSYKLKDGAEQKCKFLVCFEEKDI